MIDLALNNEMLVAARTLMRVQADRTKEQREEFLTEWERLAVQFSAGFNQKKRKGTNKKFYKGKRKLARL